jgi:hypothetical protein
MKELIKNIQIIIIEYWKTIEIGIIWLLKEQLILLRNFIWMGFLISLL